MREPGEPTGEIEALFTRISALGTANLRISASLDVTTVQYFPRAGARSLGKIPVSAQP